MSDRGSIWEAAGRKRLLWFWGGSAATSPDHDDPSLRGRSYGVAHDVVWREIHALIRTGRRRWNVRESDDRAGRILAEARTTVFGFVDDVELRVGLDGNAQTRVDMASRSRLPARTDLGANPRRIRRFLRDLDRRLSRTAAPVRDAKPKRRPGFAPHPRAHPEPGPAATSSL